MSSPSGPLGLYIHVPFCRQKCPYCDFYSIPFEEFIADAYVQAVLRALRAAPCAGRAADTVYFGGGTPSLLGPARIGALLEGIASVFALWLDAEITLEANPGTVDEDSLRGFRAAGIGRLSLGVQSAQERELRALGRSHNAGQARDAILTAHRAGFDNLSADLMLATMHQTGDSLRRSLDFLCALPLAHVSAYLLKIEPGTPLAARRDLALPDEDAAAELYLAAVEGLEAAGLRQYEISNFARPGWESRHNLKYWRCGEYLGVGPGAHSFVGGRRFFFPRDLGSFTDAAQPFALAVPDGEGGGPAEQMLLRLRLREGLDTALLPAWGAETGGLLREAEHLQTQGLCTVRGGVIALTRRGFLLSNTVIAALLHAL